MNIMVAGTMTPYSGREELELAEGLRRELPKLGHNADMFMLPYEPDILSLPEQITALNILPVESTDLLITAGYPAMFLNHPNKIIYLFETAPMLHEYWDTEYGLLYNPAFHNVKTAAEEAEKRCLAGAKAVFCGSDMLRQDLSDRYDVSAQVFYVRPPGGGYAPSRSADASAAGGEQPFAVCECDLTPCRRMELLADIVRESAEDWRLKWYAQGAREVYKEALAGLIKRNGIEGRVELHGGSCPEDVMRGAFAYVQVSYMERRISSSFMRALLCGVPAAAAEDSGAALELLGPAAKAKPESRAFASFLDRLYRERDAERRCLPDGKLESAEVLAKMMV